jgi:hypothetical protein
MKIQVSIQFSWIQVFWSCIPYKKLESKNLNGLGWNRNASYFFPTWMEIGQSEDRILISIKFFDSSFLYGIHDQKTWIQENWMETWMQNLHRVYRALIKLQDLPHSVILIWIWNSCHDLSNLVVRATASIKLKDKFIVAVIFSKNLPWIVLYDIPTHTHRVL